MDQLPSAKLGARNQCSTLETNYVHRLAFSPDGQYLVLTLARELRLWDCLAEKETRRLASPFARSLAFTRDCQRLVAGIFDGPVKVWDFSGATRDREFKGHDWPVEGVGFSLDGRSVVACGPDIRVWDADAGEQLELLKPSTSGFESCAVSPDGRTFAVGHADGAISLWSFGSLQQVALLRGHENSVRQLAFTADGERLISASQEQFRVWRAASFTEPSKPDQSNWPKPTGPF